MVRGLYAAYTGMLAQQQKMDTVSNNLANINTTGYKKDDAIFQSFSDALTMKINDPDTKVSQKIGSLNLGVKIERIYTNQEQGGFQQTDDPLSIGLEGTGMISVGTMKDGVVDQTFYTRDGSFTLDQDQHLVTKDGKYVLGENGPITIPDGTLNINKEGKLYVGDKLIDQLKIVDFENVDSLRKIGDNLYKATDSTQVKAFSGTVNQGFIESSNVNSVQEMVNMIGVMRAYEANQKVLTTYDATLDKTVNSVGRV